MDSGTEGRDLRVCYVTCGENGLYGLRSLSRAGYSISCVVTVPPTLALRYRIAGYADVAPWCRSSGIPLVSLPDYTLRKADLDGHEYDAIVVNGWNRLLTSEVIASARLGALGVHAGHPPLGLGRAPLVWSILLGQKDLEVYVFRLTERADDGDIMALRTVEITPQDDVALLYQKVMFATAALLARALDRVARREPGLRQSESDRRHFTKRTQEDGLIDFYKTEIDLFNFIRSQTRPYPGAFSYLDGRRWSVWRAVPFDTFSFRELARIPGTVVGALPAGIVVQTGGAPLWILEAECGGIPVVPGPVEEMELLIGKRFTGHAESI